MAYKGPLPRSISMINKQLVTTEVGGRGDLDRE